MRTIIITAAMLAAAGPACAQDIVVKPLVDARLRSETVHQDGVATDAEAVTLRVRAGATASADGFTALAEAQGTLAIVPHYYDGLHGAATRPIVSDPQNVALYRAQLQYKAKTVTLTGGRQRIALDDERFVGAVNFRQNGQTYDAARVEWLVLPKLKADLTYAASVRTIWGFDGRGARPGAIGGRNVFANLGYKTPLGTLTGFAYLVDQDALAVQGYRLSSQSYGGRFAGTHLLGKGVKLSYQASYATQSNYRYNPNRYRTDYYLIDGALDVRRARVGAGYEVLGAARGAAGGVALTSFQTPLATLFKFQGLGRPLPHHPAQRRSRPVWQRHLHDRRHRPGQGGVAAGGGSSLHERPARPALRRRTRPARQREAGPVRAVAPRRGLLGGHLRDAHPQGVDAVRLDPVTWSR